MRRRERSRLDFTACTPCLYAAPPGGAVASGCCENVSVAASDALAALWHVARLPADALADIDLTGADPVLPASFAVATAAQSALAAAALAAARIGRRRGGPR